VVVSGVCLERGRGLIQFLRNADHNGCPQNLGWIIGEVPASRTTDSGWRNLQRQRPRLRSPRALACAGQQTGIVITSQVKFSLTARGSLQTAWPWSFAGQGRGHVALTQHRSQCPLAPRRLDSRTGLIGSLVLRQGWVSRWSVAQRGAAGRNPETTSPRGSHELVGALSCAGIGAGGLSLVVAGVPGSLPGSPPP
jgi:hypothetical protein